MTKAVPFPAQLFRFLGLALLFMAAFPAEVTAASPAWLKLETDEFVIYTDAPEKQAVDCALRYAAFRRAFSELFIGPGHSLPPSTLLLFRKDKPFRALLPPATEKNTKVVNYSCEVDGMSLNAFALAGDRDRALEMTFEFETIWALRRLGHFVPIWMSQGAGEVLSTVTLSKGKCLVGREGDRSFDDAFAWPRFFEINQDSKDYRDSGMELARYLAQAWGLMHWILLAEGEGDRRSRFESLEQRLRTAPAIEVVPATMNTPVNQLAKSIRRHGRVLREIPFAEAAVKAAFRLSPAPEAELFVQRANLLCAAGRVPECNLQLDQARALAPDLSAVQEAWARRMLREGRPRDAMQLYREAIAAGSKNFAAYLQSALLRLDDGMSYGSDRAGEGGPEAVTAVAELRQAIRLNPGSLESYRMLGRAFYVLPALTEAHIAELSPGATTGADGELVRFYRAMLYSRLHRRDDCARDFRAILADPETSDQLRRGALSQFVQEIVALDARKVEKLVATHDYAAAFEIVATGESDPEHSVAEGFGRLRDWLQKIVRKDPNATAAERKLAGLE
jgi:tetratricopeptide (TPR) repeat protein